jgi:hypothetical protein
MADLEEMYLEFAADIAQLEVLARALRYGADNTRWHGQEREGGGLI